MPLTSIIECLENWAATQPDALLYAFLDVHGNERESYTYRSYRERTLDLASHLARHSPLQYGDRVLLAYPPGLDVIVAFLACARLGLIPVPVQPPTTANGEAAMIRLDA